MELYDWLLLVHILAAMVWVGGGIYNGALLGSMSRTATGDDITMTALRMAQVNNRVFPIASLVLIAAALWMIGINEAWTYSQTWVTLAFTLWVISMAIGGAFYGPQTKKLAGLVAEHGAGSQEARSVVERIGKVSRIDGLLLITIVLLMIWKPGV